MFTSVGLRQTFAFVYLLRGIQSLYICIVGSAAMAGIVFILLRHERKYSCSDFVETGKVLGRLAQNPASHTLTFNRTLYTFFFL